MVDHVYSSYYHLSLLQYLISMSLLKEVYTFPETNIAPENGWLEVGIPVSFWDGFFRCEFLVSGSAIHVF